MAKNKSRVSVRLDVPKTLAGYPITRHELDFILERLRKAAANLTTEANLLRFREEYHDAQRASAATARKAIIAAYRKRPAGKTESDVSTTLALSTADQDPASVSGACANEAPNKPTTTASIDLPPGKRPEPTPEGVAKPMSEVPQ